MTPLKNRYMVVNGYKWIVINCLIAVFRFITHNAFSIILGTGQVMNAFFPKHRIQKRRPRWSESEKEILVTEVEKNHTQLFGKFSKCLSGRFPFWN